MPREFGTKSLDSATIHRINSLSFPVDNRLRPRIGKIATATETARITQSPGSVFKNRGGEVFFLATFWGPC